MNSVTCNQQPASNFTDAQLIRVSNSVQKSVILKFYKVKMMSAVRLLEVKKIKDHEPYEIVRFSPVPAPLYSIRV